MGEPAEGTPTQNNEPTPHVKPPNASFSQKEDGVRADERALEKVIDLRDPPDTIAFHTLGFGQHFNSENVIIGGMFNTESVLVQGLVSKHVAERAHIQRSISGSTPDEPFLNEEDYISLYPAHYFKEQMQFRKDAISNRFPWTLITAIDRKNIRPGFGDFAEGLPETQIKGRVKPKDIIGILADPWLLDQNIRSYFDTMISSNSEKWWNRAYQADLKMDLVKQLYGTIEALQIDLPETVKTQILAEIANGEQIQQRFHQIDSDLRIAEAKAEEEKEDYDYLKHGHLIDDKPYLERMYLEVEKFDGEIRKPYEVLRAALYSDPRYAGIKTFRDYLIHIGEQYHIPIYAGDDQLIWPEQLDYDTIKKLVQDKQLMNEAPPTQPPPEAGTPNRERRLRNPETKTMSIRQAAVRYAWMHSKVDALDGSTTKTWEQIQSDFATDPLVNQMRTWTQRPLTEDEFWKLVVYKDPDATRELYQDQPSRLMKDIAGKAVEISATTQNPYLRRSFDSMNVFPNDESWPYFDPIFLRETIGESEQRDHGSFYIHDGNRRLINLGRHLLETGEPYTPIMGIVGTRAETGERPEEKKRPLIVKGFKDREPVPTDEVINTFKNAQHIYFVVPEKIGDIVVGLGFMRGIIDLEEKLGLEKKPKTLMAPLAMHSFLRPTAEKLGIDLMQAPPGTGSNRAEYQAREVLGETAVVFDIDSTGGGDPEGLYFGQGQLTIKNILPSLIERYPVSEAGVERQKNILQIFLAWTKACLIRLNANRLSKSPKPRGMA